MSNITDTINSAFRDFAISGQPSSGPHDVNKAEVRALGPILETALANIGLGSLLSEAYATRAELDADLAHDADAVALVYDDPSAINNDLYVKTGASGSGSWTLTTVLQDVAASLTGPSLNRSSNSVPFKLWSDLAAAVDMVDGDRASVLDSDAGSHVDPVTSNTVPNAGVYEYDGAVPGWRRIEVPSDEVSGHFGSIQFDRSNGWNTDLTKRGMLEVDGSQTGMLGIGQTNFFDSDCSIVVFCDPAKDHLEGFNTASSVFSNADQNLAQGRHCGLYYFTHFYSSPAVQRGKFYFAIRGEGVSDAWQIPSAQIPLTAKGPFAVLIRNDGSNGYCDVYDIGAELWYAGAAVAKPSGYVGPTIWRDNLVFGDAGNQAWPKSQDRFLADAWRGAISDFIVCNKVLTSAHVEAMLDGADVVLEAVTAGATKYLYAPLVDHEGKIDPTVVTTESGMEAGIIQYGSVFPGPTMRARDAAKVLRTHPLHWPHHFAVKNGEKAATGLLEFELSGMSGKMQYRFVRESGEVLTGWREAPHKLTGTRGVMELSVPRGIGHRWQVQIRNSDDATLIASTHSSCQVGPRIALWGQSEAVLALSGLLDRSVRDTTLNVRATNSIDHIVFGARMLASGVGETAFLTDVSETGGILGDGAVALANALSRVTSEPMLIDLNTVSGTSILDVMNDGGFYANGTVREWAEFQEIASLGPVNANGDFIYTAHIMAGWEAFYGGGDDVIGDVYAPFLTGVGNSTIPQADLDHWIGSEVEDGYSVVVIPCNRASVGLGGATDTDASTEADQRDYFRNYSHILGYKIAPEQASHKMQGENSAGSLPSGAVTHQEANDLEGEVETALSYAEAVALAVDASKYAPVFFESIRAGSASNKVIVSLGSPRKHPGNGLAVGAPGHSLAQEVVDEIAARNLHVKKNGGNPGACFEASIDGGGFSLNNVTSGLIINPLEVELTLITAPSSTVEIKYKPGSSGRYSTATITQEAWRSGCLYWTGRELPPTFDGADADYLEDMLNLGFEVCGSNQTLSHNVT